ncbi:multicopper oxidase family protein [Tessaracoccus antarcticus]|uniref:Phenoxazinone synthase n=1 Tax=Tessaracoccus antarcticus TaxID=2479848 RepID=A0A3M0GEM3_9ACTN|nr:multicopper oxidase domain-containing protein [Tessaracoccus antarcticus]RMB61112.1 hypothetical protein EAX62_00015 [Tessaracoccus antarcticus]
MIATSSPTTGDLYAARFTAELTFPPVAHLTDQTREVRVARHSLRLHPLLPPTPVWCYEMPTPGGPLINPTLEVERGVPSRIRWANALHGQQLPITVASVHGTDPATDGVVVVSNHPGTGCPEPNFVTDLGVRRADATWAPTALVPPVIAPHLHGGVTEAASDGWMETLFAAGQSSLYEYRNDQPSTLLWYHDHAAHITRLNVYAGMAGLYIVRDDDDRRVMRALRLHREDDPPYRHRYELPMLIQDLNLDLTADGRLSGVLLHKVESGEGPMEFFGPYTMVNRKIWPKVTVHRRQYRLRLINGSNARTFSLTLMSPDGVVPWSDIATVIGTDGGLRGMPMTAAPDLVLAPAERLDVIVDFGLVDAAHLEVVNTAAAPYGGSAIRAFRGEALPGSEGWEARVRYPEVMRFDLVGNPHTPRPLPTLAGDFRRIVHEAADGDPGEAVVVIPDTGVPGHHQHRYVALVEEEMVPGDPAMLTLRELMPHTPGDEEMDRLIELTEPDPSGSGALVTRLWRTAAKMFHDAGVFTCVEGQVEVWKLINLSPDTHPVHLHLTAVQILGRIRASAAGTVPDPDALDWLDFDSHDPEANPVSVTLDEDVAITEADRAWKDVIRVDPGEMVKIAVPFGVLNPATNTYEPTGMLGRFMYHCHILEHEDHDMMRHFWVAPQLIGELMTHHH